MCEPMTESSATDMSDQEKRVIWAFAQGDRGKRDEAVAIHRKWLPILGARGTREQRFMAEVDHSVPDRWLRENLRLDMLLNRPTQVRVAEAMEKANEKVPLFKGPRGASS